MNNDKALVDRMLNVFNDTPEIASWFEQGGGIYDYKMGETRTHLLGMWETMQEAAHRIEAQADTVTQAVANERAKILDWLRDGVAMSDFYLNHVEARELAQYIEAGEHLK